MVNTERNLGPRPLHTNSTLFDGIVLQYELDFWEYHKANPAVYKLFCRFADEAIKKGHTKLSAKLIVNRIRWESYIETSTVDYKINDRWHSYYGRLWMLDKNMPNFFEKRVMNGEFSEGIEEN